MAHPQRKRRKTNHGATPSSRRAIRPHRRQHGLAPARTTGAALNNQNIAVLGLAVACVVALAIVLLPVVQLAPKCTDPGPKAPTVVIGGMKLAGC